MLLVPTTGDSIAYDLDLSSRERIMLRKSHLILPSSQPSNFSMEGDGSNLHVGTVKNICAFCEETWNVPVGEEREEKTKDTKDLESIAADHFKRRVLRAEEVTFNNINSIVDDVSRCYQLLNSVILCNICVRQFCLNEMKILEAQENYLKKMSGPKEFGEMLADPWLDLKRFAFTKLKDQESSVAESIRLIKKYIPAAGADSSRSQPASNNELTVGMLSTSNSASLPTPGGSTLLTSITLSEPSREHQVPSTSKPQTVEVSISSDQFAATCQFAVASEASDSNSSGSTTPIQHSNTEDKTSDGGHNKVIVTGQSPGSSVYETPEEADLGGTVSPVSFKQNEKKATATSPLPALLPARLKLTSTPEPDVESEKRNTEVTPREDEDSDDEKQETGLEGHENEVEGDVETKNKSSESQAQNCDEDDTEMATLRFQPLRAPVNPLEMDTVKAPSPSSKLTQIIVKPSPILKRLKLDAPRARTKPKVRGDARYDNSAREDESDSDTCSIRSAPPSTRTRNSPMKTKRNFDIANSDTDTPNRKRNKRNTAATANSSTSRMESYRDLDLPPPFSVSTENTPGPVNRARRGIKSAVSHTPENNFENTPSKKLAAAAEGNTTINTETHSPNNGVTRDRSTTPESKREKSLRSSSSASPKTKTVTIAGKTFTEKDDTSTDDDSGSSSDNE